MMLLTNAETGDIWDILGSYIDDVHIRERQFDCIMFLPDGPSKSWLCQAVIRRLKEMGWTVTVL